MFHRSDVKKGRKKEDKNKRKNTHSIGSIFLKIKPVRELLFRQKQVKEYVSAMEPRARPETALTNLWEKRMGVLFVVAVATVLLWVICFTGDDKTGMLENGHYVRRPETEEAIELKVSGEGTEGRWEKLFSFDVSDRVFTPDEKIVIGNRVDHYVSEKILGKNMSKDHVTERLVFPKSVPGTEVELSWTVDEKYLRDNGTLIASHIPKGGVGTEVMLEAKWKNYKGVYHYDIHLDEPVISPEKLAAGEAKKEIKKAFKDQADDALVELPSGYMYEEQKEGKSYLSVFAMLAVMFALPFLWREQIKRGISMREEQLMVDHPGFINKVMLLLGAGLTLRFAIERIAGEYERELEDGGSRHFVYEELCVTMQELKDGVTEAQAIENFGRRCRCMPYMRFSSVVTQNLRKGAEGLLMILEQEASDSLIERKQAALRKGEVAGTKLLFPMMVMLGLVMGIIMVPAFMSM